MRHRAAVTPAAPAAFPIVAGSRRPVIAAVAVIVPFLVGSLLAV
jgi:hypothetical protein